MHVAFICMLTSEPKLRLICKICLQILSKRFPDDETSGIFIWLEAFDQQIFIKKQTKTMSFLMHFSFSSLQQYIYTGTQVKLKM